MYRLFAACLVIVTATTAVAGQTPFQLYESKKFAESLQGFLQLEKQGAGGKDLYLNIAKVYARLNYYPQAILYAERALLWEPNCKICKDMLSQYNRAAGIDTFTPEPFFLQTWYLYVAGSLRPWYWFLLSMIALSAALFLWKINAVIAYQSVAVRILLGVFALCLTFSYSENYRRTHRFRAVLLEASALHLSPDPMSQKKEDLIPGEVFFVTDKIGEWSKVRTKGLDVGWLETKRLHFIAM